MRFFSILVSVVGYAILLVMCIIFLTASAVAFVVCYPFDPRRRVVHNLSRCMVYVFYGLFFRPFWRCKVEGLENIDPKKSYVVMFNHTNMNDIPILYFLPLDFRWVSKQEVFKVPFIGQFLILHGDILIERGSPTEAMSKVRAQGREWLSKGVSVAIFPEGTRSRSGELLKFKSGAFRLAQEAGVEILPVVAHGTGSLISPKGLMGCHGRVKLRVLPAVSAQKVAQTELKELVDEVRAQMKTALDEVRASAN